MTTLDQIRLLETKVESAVAKMQQLQAENDALRNKCAELTNALEGKTEQLLAFTSNKEEIEEGIKNALDRLNYIENSVLGTDKVNSNGQGSIHITPGAGLSSIEPITEDVHSKETISESPKTIIDDTISSPAISKDSVSPVVENVSTEHVVVNDSTDKIVESDLGKTVPSFDTMKMSSKQPEVVNPDSVEEKNDIDEGDQDAFEYDIF